MAYTDSQQVKFVAEIASNHNQDFNRAIQLIEEAARIGCWGVKFQLFRVDKMYERRIANLTQGKKDWELPISFLPDLKSCAADLGLKFGCSPFYLEAVEELYPWVDFYKVASYEILWSSMLDEISKTGKDVILSTGMATFGEILCAIARLNQIKTILHCVSSYPTKTVDCNLGAIGYLNEFFSIPLGWSDHSHNPAVIYRAAHRWEAAMIEFHFDLEDRKGFEAGLHCWAPSEIGPIIQNVNSGFLADGDGVKSPRQCELEEVMWRRDPQDGLRPMLSARNP